MKILVSTLATPAAALMLMAVVIAAEEATSSNEQQWQVLFNGRDLEGWQVQPADAAAGVFTVVTEDGAPAIRVSGETLAGLATLGEFEDYHLELEFKWGDERFGARAQLPFDSGLLYHAGEQPHRTTGWLESVEFGILEGGETGDFWSVPGISDKRTVIVDVLAEEIRPEMRRYPNEALRYDRAGENRVGVNDGILNCDDNEKPHGQWNKLDLYCLGQTAVHVVNGTPNLLLQNIRRRVEGGDQPLTRGRLQLQCEWAEVYFRGLRLRPIDAIPADVTAAMTETPPNTLSEEQQASGWRLLFDGRTMAGWRGYRRSDAPEGWQVRDGCLTRTGTAGELISCEQFADFELSIDWRISHGGNSGIFYGVTERSDVDHLYLIAPEYELRDNAFWTDDPYTAAACYALYPPESDASHPVGYWNRARILKKDDRVEHWLNGVRVVSYERNSDDWRARLSVSKLGPRYGQAARGHIGLQDHGDFVWFRNIRIRPLKDE